MSRFVLTFPLTQAVEAFDLDEVLEQVPVLAQYLKENDAGSLAVLADELDDDLQDMGYRFLSLFPRGGAGMLVFAQRIEGAEE